MIPDYHQNEEFLNRSRKLSEIRELGIEPYPHKYPTTEKAAQLALDAEGTEDRRAARGDRRSGAGGAMGL